MGFIRLDDGLHALVIHFRSASRVGQSDLGVNRQRMQAIVQAYEAHDDSAARR